MHYNPIQYNTMHEHIFTMDFNLLATGPERVNTVEYNTLQSNQVQTNILQKSSRETSLKCRCSHHHVVITFLIITNLNDSHYQFHHHHPHCHTITQGFR